METQYLNCGPELWGGLECTINRVNNTFRDQLREANYYDRIDDINKVVELGIKKLRFPILWEFHQHDERCEIDWTFTGEKLNILRDNGVEPIAGLLHHGSGPAFTQLNDPDFPEKLADYAYKVAKKFPWLQWYTPVNEPLTTARFSGLYGLWYPHHQSEKSFFEMFLHQLKGIVLSMQAIRSVNPSAKLVQTEDLSKTHSTELLNYQAAFENKRRWLTYDFLCGYVDAKHYFWKYLLRLGIDKKLLSFFCDNPCPPDIIGFNYYVTSERFLDDQIHNYPNHLHGGNGKHEYADVEAVRKIDYSGLSNLLKEAWERYKLPMAITECHLNCTREEQMRWLHETWDTCCVLKKEGIDIQAVTAWSLLGAYDWNSLLTKFKRQYESGVFAIEDNKLRATALVTMVKSLARFGSYNHPVLHNAGWWNNKKKPTVQKRKSLQTRYSPILIIGSKGTLGNAFTRICTERNIDHKALDRYEANILDVASINNAIDKYKPWAIINASGYVRVDEAEQQKDECFALNAIAPAGLAKICKQKGLQFMSFSSDLVFDGLKHTPYREADAVKPLNVYGASKAKGEKLILADNPDSLIIRSSAFFGPWDQYNFVYTVLDSLRNSNSFTVPNNVFVSPTYVPDLVNTALDIFIDNESGVWHLASDGCISWSDFAKDIARRSGNSNKFLVTKPACDMGWAARRPIYSPLQSSKGIKMPGLDGALEKYFEQTLY